MLYPLPDLANLYLLSYLEKHGFQTEIVNAALDNLTEKQFLNRLAELSPKTLILHSVILAKPADIEIIPKILATIPAPILIHGPEPTRVPEEYLSGVGNAAYNERLLIFRGEPEKNILNYLQFGGKDGVSFFEGDQIVHHPHTFAPIPIEEIPHTFHFHPTVKRLSSQFLNAKFPKQPVAAMLVSRGCPFTCSYCVPNSVSFARELEYRTAHANRKPKSVYANKDRVIDEFKTIKEAGYPSVMVMDDQFLASKTRTLKICEGIQSLGLQWGCLSRPDFLADEETVAALAKSGCISIDIGIETLSQHLLDLIDKRLDLRTFYEAVPLLQRYGVEPKINILFGASEKETEEDIIQTVDELIRLKVHHVMFAIATPFKGTPFYEQAKEKNILIDDSDAIDPFRKSMISYPHLSADRLQELIRYAYQRFYLRPSQFFYRLKSYRSWTFLKNDARVVMNLFLHRHNQMGD